MTEEDEAFNDIERQSQQRKEAVQSALKTALNTDGGLQRIGVDMTQEALKLVLETLYPIAHNTTDDPRGQAYKAIAALEKALAQTQEPVQQCRACFGMGFVDGEGNQCLTCNGTGEQPPQRKPLNILEQGGKHDTTTS